MLVERLSKRQDVSGEDQHQNLGDFQFQQLVLHLDKVISSDSRMVDDVVCEITEALDRTACWNDVEADIQAIGLALREALANAIVHGNHCDPEKAVCIFVVVNENCDLLASVKDSGSGFDPSELRNPTAAENLLAPHGRGIFLIRHLMDEVDFKFDHGTEIRMLRRQRLES
jgi:serine/threonine-protein kinase RsbW